MSQLVRLRGLFVPASIVLFLLFTAGWYNFFWLPSESRFLDDRNFRVLHTLSDQIRLTIDNFDRIMDNADASGIHKGDLNSYLLNVAPQLQVPKEDESGPVIGKDFSDPPKIAVAADEGTHFLYLAFKGKSSEYAIRTDLDKLIDRLLPPANRNPFDVLLLAKSNGVVIFQKPLSGLDVARIDNLEKASTDAKRTPQDTQLTVKSLSGASNLEDVMLEGARYRLYAQPLKISFALAEPEKKSGKGAATAATPDPWILCALVRSDHFRSESQSISYKYILWLSAAILIVIAVYPFLRINVSSCEERLRASHVSIAAVFACILAAAVTFALLDAYYWLHEFDSAAEEQMERLAKAINSNFDHEKTLAFRQLSDFYREDPGNKKELRIALRNAESQYDKDPKLPKLTMDGAGCTPPWSCQAKILSESHFADLLKSYPYLEYVGWSDFRGKQRVKWTTRKSVTPFLDLDNPSILYYPAVKSALQSPGGSNPIPTEGVGTNYSPNTGRMVTVFWKIMDTEGKEVTGYIDRERQKKVFCASLVTNPLSVFGPVLPDGFQFAVIKPDGSVVFHSDTSLNLLEDFVAETDHDQSLKARLSMRLGGPLIANYLGQAHRLYLQPMASSPGGSWTIVIFRSLRAEGTMNLEMLSLSSMLFLLYAVILALVLLLMGWMRGNQVIGIWLWPDSRKIDIYRRLFAGNGLAALLLFALSQRASLAALIFYGFFIPLGTTILNLLFLRRQDDRNSGNDNEGSAAGHWQLAYIAASVTLLLVIAVLPCLSFFKAACDFEQELAMKRMQLELVSDIHKRAERVRSHFQGLDVGTFASELMAVPGDGSTSDDEGKPFYSYHKTLGTTIEPSPEKPPQPVTCGLGRSSSTQRCAELFLSWSSPLYDELAASTRYLGEAGSSDTRFWSSDSSGAKETLTLITSGRRISSPWTPFRVRLGEWQWWLGLAVFISLVFLLVRFTVYQLFLLDPLRRIQETSPAAVLDPAELIATLPQNLLVIGPESCRTIRKLIDREDLQVWDTHKMSDEATATVPFAEAVDCIVQDGRGLVLRIVDCALDDLDSSRKIRLALEKIISKLGKSVVIISQVDPGAGALADERKPWETLLSAFVRLDLRSSPVPRASDTDDQFDRRTVADAYYCWRFSGLPKSQRLVLVHLAQEGLINPNCRSVAWDLLEDGLIRRRWGILAISDSGFADFLKSTVSPTAVKRLERHVGDGRSASLQVSLSVAVICVIGFLIYTQGEVFNTWVTYATGVAASVPAFMKALSILRGKGGADA